MNLETMKEFNKFRRKNLSGASGASCCSDSLHQGRSQGAKLAFDWLEEKIQSLEQENKMLKEENLKLRCCENCIHYDIVTECELTAITCTNYNKWEIKK